MLNASSNFLGDDSNSAPAVFSDDMPGLSVRGGTTPTGMVSRTGDQSIVLHWDRSSEPDVSGYRIYRSLTNGAPFVMLATIAAASPGYCDFSLAS
jgi:hypothetical protein